MGLIDNLRETVNQKAKGISNKLETSYREHLGEELTNRKDEIKDLENALKIYEEILNSRASEISAREASISKYYLVPRKYINIPAGFILLAALIFGLQAIAPQISTEQPHISVAPTEPTPSTKETVSTPSYSDCLSKGITYYKELGSYPYLSTGEDASKKVEGMCNRTGGMAFSY